MSTDLASTRRLSPAVRTRLVVEIARAYMRARRATSGRTLPEALATLRDARPAVTAPLTPAEGVRLGRAVRLTLRFVPARTTCLVQSLVLTDLLARRGTASTLVIGVRPGERFGAHAWIELDGTPLLPPQADEFARLAEL